ncbi:MAG TPA: iron-sulfur cluster repair di-iron protein [Clostridia bacterium]|nr:iron-sulfur cluster repair di-iron protein [Clostridia bacterium]
MTQMTLDANKTVREFAVELPSAIRVFEKFGIDYCCGGGKTLVEVCSAAKLPVETVLDTLSRAESEREHLSEGQSDYRTMPLADLIAHIVTRHHNYVRDELPRLEHLLGKVAAKHGPNHPEVPQVQPVFAALSQELTMHLMKEEEVLFPYIVRMEEAAVAKEPAPPPSFGSVQNPVRMMMSEHDSAGDALRRMRQLTSDYTVPADGCMSFHALYEGLADFEADLHQHIHLENNILFPRAISIEDVRYAGAVSGCGHSCPVEK